MRIRIRPLIAEKQKIEADEARAKRIDKAHIVPTLPSQEAERADEKRTKLITPIVTAVLPFLFIVGLQFSGGLLIAWTNWLYENLVVVRPGFSERQIPAIVGYLMCIIVGATGGEILAEGSKRWRVAWVLWGFLLLILAFFSVGLSKNGTIPIWLGNGLAVGLGISGLASMFGWALFRVTSKKKDDQHRI